MVYAGFILNIDSRQDISAGAIDPALPGRGRSASSIQPRQAAFRRLDENKLFGLRFSLGLREGRETAFDKLVALHAEKHASVSPATVWAEGCDRAAALHATSFDRVLADNEQYWQAIWGTFDIDIEGDPENQQGIRFCVFQLEQTYRGRVPGANLGAKGLTGEVLQRQLLLGHRGLLPPLLPVQRPSHRPRPPRLPLPHPAAGPGARRRARLHGRLLPGGHHRRHRSAAPSGSTPASSSSPPRRRLRDPALRRGSRATTISSAAGASRCSSEIARFLASRAQWSEREGRLRLLLRHGPGRIPDDGQPQRLHQLHGRQRSLEYAVEVLHEMRAPAAGRYPALAEPGLGRARRPGDREAGSDSAADVHPPGHGCRHLSSSTTATSTCRTSTSIPSRPRISRSTTTGPTTGIYRNDMIKQPDVLMFMLLYDRSPSAARKAGQLRLLRAALHPRILALSLRPLHPRRGARPAPGGLRLLRLRHPHRPGQLQPQHRRRPAHHLDRRGLDEHRLRLRRHALRRRRARLQPVDTRRLEVV